MTAKVISIINMKGGVGKTTLTKEIGFHMASSDHKRVLLIDADPQANLTQSFFRRYRYRQPAALAMESDKKSSTFTVQEATINRLYSNSTGLTPPHSDVIVDFPDLSLSLIPGDLNTLFMETNTESSTMRQALINYLYYSEPTPEINNYDYVLIDCPPTYSSYTVAALLATDHILIPVKPDDYSVLGIKMLTKVVHNVQANNKAIYHGRKLTNLGIIFTDITSKPQPGLLATMKLIEHSRDLADKYFFENWFLKNNGFFKHLDYFADLSNSTRSKENLSAILAELYTRIGD
ncbi:ParA family protein [Schleiferilactobacillus harbinensis]|uniref:ParA family protein n=1 Tax=Schleiferilactobacillus harbinensis TaxID=304207 RepID=UPI001AAF2FED|nr:AAA family ATPase [Schleiferilactobacillus harbinensis]MBO3093084.1 ParA family protein [Schleiferilactobacillus harbinensis]